MTFNKFNNDKDHIHLLLEFAPDIHPSKFINTLKTVTLRFITKKYFTYLDKYY
ncbi:transposase [Borreliella bissettiae]|uniref:transposase n=1 Tax=Borrelia bissettiae TaxID=64897 RepID=UPI0009D95914